MKVDRFVKEEFKLAVVFVSILLVLFMGGSLLLVNAEQGLSSANEQLDKEESKRYELVAQELNLPKKHLLIESRFLSHLYDVNADGDRYTVEFNDDCTRIVKIVKE